MSSADFTFITLRNITAYQPSGAWVPSNYILNMGTNGSAVWTNNLNVNGLTASSIVGSTIYATSGIVGSTIIGSTIVSNNVVALSSIVIAPSFFSTITDYNYTGTSTVSSILIGIGDNIWKIPVEFVSANI